MTLKGVSLSNRFQSVMPPSIGSESGWRHCISEDRRVCPARACGTVCVECAQSCSRFRSTLGACLASYPTALESLARFLMPLSPLENPLIRLDLWLGGRFCRPPVLFVCIPSSLNLSPQSVRIVVKSRTQIIHASREKFLYRGPLDHLLANVLASRLSEHDICGLAREFAEVTESDG